MLKGKTIDRLLWVLSAILVVLFVQVVRDARGAQGDATYNISGPPQELRAKSVASLSQEAQDRGAPYRTIERQDVEPIVLQRRADNTTVVDLRGGGV